MRLDQQQIDIKKDVRNVSGAVTLDFDAFDVFYLTLTGSITSLTSTGGEQGRAYPAYFIQGGTGNFTLIGLDAKFKVRQGRTILLSTAVGDVDMLEFDFVSSTNILLRPDYAS